MTRVVVPYAANPDRDPPAPGLFPETEQAVRRHFPDALFVDVSSSPSAYFELLQSLWQDSSSDLVVIEHDIVPHAGVAHAFRYCPHPWCAFPYRKASHQALVALGCTRFRASLIRQTSDLWGRVARHGDDREVGDGMPSRHWLRTDTRMDFELRRIEYEWRGQVRSHRPHAHSPNVGHLDPATARLHSA